MTTRFRCIALGGRGPLHLYGLAGECALKAVLCGLGIIRGRRPRGDLKVHINKLWNEFNIQIYGRGLPPLGSCPFDDWRAEHRYEDDDRFDSERVERHHEGAREGMMVMQIAQERGFVR